MKLTLSVKVPPLVSVMGADPVQSRRATIDPRSQRQAPPLRATPSESRRSRLTDARAWERGHSLPSTDLLRTTSEPQTRRQQARIGISGFLKRTTSTGSAPLPPLGGGGGLRYRGETAATSGTRTSCAY